MTAPSSTSLSKCLIVLWMRLIVGRWNSCCARPLGSSSWVSSSRDVMGSGRYDSPGIQPVHKQVRMGILLALRGATACAAAQKRGTHGLWNSSNLGQANWRSSVLTSGSIFCERRGYSHFPLVTTCAHARIACLIKWPTILSRCFCTMIRKR